MTTANEYRKYARECTDSAREALRKRTAISSLALTEKPEGLPPVSEADMLDGFS